MVSSSIYKEVAAEKLVQTEGRRRQARGDTTKTKIIAASVREFSERGYDGVSLRDVETSAGLQRGLAKYHFGSKEELFKAVVDDIFGALDEYRYSRNQTERNISSRERLGFRIRSFVRYSAQRPELNRLMSQEGKHDSWRLRYILDVFLRRAVNDTKDLAVAHLSLTSEAFCHWYYLYVGSGAFVFSMAPEARQLFGIDVSSEEFIDRHADMVADMLLSVMQMPDGEVT
ncbi:MAG: TetR family transcriptional regulator [Pseudomonadota bacterium]